MQCTEITIPIPYGQLAAKWWGRRDVRPIVCLHGWLDNAGSFDTLIPLLPDHVGYLAIDLPGHGLSSYQPHGIIYGDTQFLYILHYVFRAHFKWPSVSVIAHSMSSRLVFTYAALFPDYVDLFVGFESLKPFLMCDDFQRKSLEAIFANVLPSDLYNQRTDTKPSTYTWPQIVDITVRGSKGSLHAEAAAHLLKRGTRASQQQPDRYYFSRDNRLKSPDHLLSTSETNMQQAAKIRCAFMMIKAEDWSWYQGGTFFWETADVLKRENPRFEYVGVQGGHHVHLTHPERVSEQVSRFIRQYRPEGRTEEVLSKL